MSKKAAAVKTLTKEEANAPIAITTPDVIANAMKDPHIIDIPDELVELEAPTATPVTPKTPKAPKVKKEKTPKQDKPAKEPIKFDLESILDSMPTEFTPAILDKAFALNDGGKTVRRHLRAHFAEAMAHNKKDKWTFTRDSSTDIITYFASRYLFHADALTVTASTVTDKEKKA